MKKSRRLKPVITVAANREQQAARALGASQELLHQAQQRLRELEAYREDYLQRFRQAGAAGMGAVQLVDYRRFLHRLGLAIEEQGRLARQAAQVVEAKRALWFASRGKRRSLDNVVARYRAVEQKQEAYREQAEQDERAQRDHGGDGR